MSEFTEHKRTNVAEMREVTREDILQHEAKDGIAGKNKRVSISEADLQNGSPKIGDWIARNPKNHEDQWLVAESYYEENFKPVMTQNEYESTHP